MMRARLVDVIGNRRGAHKADRLHIGMNQQRIHSFFIALHHIKNTIRQPRFFKQLRHKKRRRWINRARLQNKAITCRNGHWKHPQGHHDGEVKRRDACDHAQRLAHRPIVDACADLLGVIALQKLRNARGEFHNLDAARDLALRIGKHLAMLSGDHSCQIIFV